MVVLPTHQLGLSVSRLFVRLSLTICLALLPTPLLAQGAMTSGENHDGSISNPLEVDMWTFSAVQGDYLRLSIGEVLPAGPDPGFRPYMQLFDPFGALVATRTGALAAHLGIEAPFSGTYSVVVTDSPVNRPGTALGDYILRLVKVPGVTTIPAGDEGGLLTNGGNHSGDITRADIDTWTFTAGLGDYVKLTLGEVLDSEVDPDFRPYVQLVGPLGDVVSTSSGQWAAHITMTAPLSGTYTVLVSDSAVNREGLAQGEYLLRLARVPAPHTPAPDDEGGPLTNGQNHAGIITRGDLDIWSFQASLGEYFRVSIGEVLNSEIDPGFVPYMQIIRPDGVVVGTRSGLWAAHIALAAPLSGTYTVVVTDSAVNREGLAQGSYLLRLVKAPGEFEVPVGDQGGLLGNGENHPGDITRADLDPWRFTASQGEYVRLSLGEVLNSEIDPGFVPSMTVIGPTGSVVASASGQWAAHTGFNAPLSGTYTVLVFDSDVNREGSAQGSYIIRFAKAPGVFSTPAGDEGGMLGNGTDHPGTIARGDLDQWEFTATIGDYLNITVGETMVGEIDPGFVPYVVLVGPTGVVHGTASGLWAAHMALQAPLSGTYRVIVFDSPVNREGLAQGSYVLRLARVPAPFSIPSGDQGGELTTGFSHPGDISRGDLDIWTFSANQGNSLQISISEVVPGEIDPGFNPWIKLIRPNGTIQTSATGTLNATINLVAPIGGTYTVIVSDSAINREGLAEGSYLLSVSGNTPNLVVNGNFNSGLTGWQTFATPNLSYMVANVIGGVLNLQRLAPPPGTTNQATVFRETAVAVPAGSPVVASFDLGNSSPTRKRISVLILENNFSDLAVCTFWLPPNTPLQTYGIRTHTTQTWTNAAIYFYAATAGTDGAYLIDNVSLSHSPTGSATRTECLDPQTPSAPGGDAGPNLLVNGNFGSGNLAPGWATFGQITSQVASGVFEFIKNAGAPAGVLLQPTGEAMTTGQVLTSTFQLGNSSGVRKRVTVILHDNSFSDLSACTFWLAPGQPLSTYTYRTYTTQPWTNATLSVYPATVGADQWMRFDNATLQRTPGVAIVGTECLEPGSSPDAPNDEWAGDSWTPAAGMALGATPATQVDPAGRTAARSESTAPTNLFRYWIIDGFVPVGDWLGGPSWSATADGVGTRSLQMAEPLDLAGALDATLSFDSTLSASASTASVQVSVEGGPWETVQIVDASESAIPTVIDLSPYLGRVIHLRFVLATEAPPGPDSSDSWRIDDLAIDIDGHAPS